jgi:hypothetical protein
MDQMWIVLLLSWRADRLHIREEVAATEHAAVVAAAAAVAAFDICVHSLEALEKLAAVVAAAAALDICVHALEIAHAHEKLAAAAAAVHVETLAAADIHAEIAHALDVSVHALAIDPVVVAVASVAVWRVLLLPVPTRAAPVQDYHCFVAAAADVAADTADTLSAAVALSAAGIAADTDVPPDPSSR